MHRTLRLGLVIALLPACGGDDSEDMQPDLDPSGQHHTFVVDQIDLPTSPTEASTLGLDIDGDGEVDNKLGSVLATIDGVSAAVDLQGSADDGLARGAMINLVDLFATDLTIATGAGARVLIGSDPMPSPCADAGDMVCGRHLDGSGSFSVSSSSPSSSWVVGNIAGSAFAGGPGDLSFQMSLSAGSTPLTFNLIAARAEFDVSESGLMNGLLGGGITEDELNTNVLPGIHQLLVSSAQDTCMGSPGSCCTEGSTGELIYNLFDDDGDCDLTFAEFSTNGFVTSLTGPDVDLVGGDGTDDSLSVGIGFTAVAAEFTPPD